MCSHCKKESKCGCLSHQNDCTNLGPFKAVDAACIAKPAPSKPTGSIIPFSSGITPVVLATIAGGLVGTASIIGMGSAVPGVSIAGNSIDLSSIVTESFSVPRAGNITEMSASFTVAVGTTLIGTTTVNAKVYKAPAGSSIFTATDATVNLEPSFTSILTVGNTASGSATFAPIPVEQGDRLIMVISIEATGVTIIQELAGTVSAGITIS